MGGPPHHEARRIEVIGRLRRCEVPVSVASRLIERCDAVFRMEGNSTGADEDVRLARQRGLPCTRESRKFLELVLSNLVAGILRRA